MAAVLIAKQLRLVMNVQYGANLAVNFVEMECLTPLTRGLTRRPVSWSCLLRSVTLETRKTMQLSTFTPSSTGR